MKQSISLDEVASYLPEIHRIQNKEWREKICRIWQEAYEVSAWENFSEMPFNYLTPGFDLIGHTRGTTLSALAIAENLETLWNVSMDKDVLLASCLLHDVCKAIEYAPGENPGRIVKSDKGKVYQHGFLSAYYAMREGFPDEVVSIVLSHTGASRVCPDSLEGIALYYADMAFADFPRKQSGIKLLMESTKG
jgi:putative nucleotidyltransferase with HDIG domain